MICTYKNKDGILIVTFPEVVTESDFLLFPPEFDSIEKEYEELPDRIIDLRPIKVLEGSFDLIHQIAQHRVKKQLGNHIKSAFLITSDLQRGFDRMFQTLNHNPRISLEIFTDESKALEWTKSKGPHS